MDVKGVFRNINPFNVKNVKDARRVQTGAATDRDANGQQSREGEKQPPRTLSQSELEEAVLYLQGLAGIKDNNLRVRLEQKDGITVVYVEDMSGNVVRRIPESDLEQLTKNRQKSSGHLLNKAL